MKHYHISSQDLGPRVTLKPKIPETAPKKEGADPRVCFAPSIERCLHSIVSTKQVTWFDVLDTYLTYSFKDLKVQNPVVYVTQSEKLKRPPQAISDFARTGEMWSSVDILVTREAYLDLRGILLKKEVGLKLTNRKYSVFSTDERRVWVAVRKLVGRNLYLGD